MRAFLELGFVPGEDFDLVTVRYPTSDQNQGIGGLTSAAILDGYSSLVYAQGSVYSGLWAGNSFYTRSEAAAINTWLSGGGKKGLFLGEHAVSYSGWTSDGLSLTGNLGAELVDGDLVTISGGFTNLQVTPLGGNGALPVSATWYVNAGCPSLRMIDALIPSGAGSASLATLEPAGSTGGMYSAAIAKDNATLNNQTITVPLDLVRVLSPDEGFTDGQAITGRARLLGGLLNWLNLSGTGVSPVPDAQEFTLAAYPNPFNPVTTISYTMPQAGYLSLRIFDMRGRLVRKLIEENLAAGPGKIVWDGLDEAGSRASSGVYFYKARTTGEAKVGKITMIK